MYIYDILSNFNLYWTTTRGFCNNASAISEDFDNPAHTHRLTRAFASRIHRVLGPRIRLRPKYTPPVALERSFTGGCCAYAISNSYTMGCPPVR